MAKNESKNENKVKKHFFKDFKAELKKVIWPTPKQLVNNTVAVVTIVLITAVIVFILDLGFDMLNKYGISNVQNIVNEKFNSEEENTTDENTDNVENQENNEDAEEDTNTTEQTPEENTTVENPETPVEGENTNNIEQ